MGAHKQDVRVVIEDVVRAIAVVYVVVKDHDLHAMLGVVWRSLTLTLIFTAYCIIMLYYIYYKGIQEKLIHDLTTQTRCRRRSMHGMVGRID